MSIIRSCYDKKSYNNVFIKIEKLRYFEKYFEKCLFPLKKFDSDIKPYLMGIAFYDARRFSKFRLCKHGSY
jgi:hypothetical protein